MIQSGLISLVWYSYTTTMINKNKLWCSKCKDYFHSEFDLFAISETGLCSLCCQIEGEREDILTMPDWFGRALLINDPLIHRKDLIVYKPRVFTEEERTEETRARWRVRKQASRARKLSVIVKAPPIVYQRAVNKPNYYEVRYDNIHNGICRRCGKRVPVRSWWYCEECTI